MATTGSGIGTPITVTPAAGVDAPALVDGGAVPLHRYAAIVGHDESAFFGVQRAGFEPNCSSMWTDNQRADVARALIEAQYLMEGELAFPLVPTWVTATPGVDPRLFDERELRQLLRTRWCMVTAPGVRAESVISSGADVGYGTEPATITASVAAEVQASEIQIRYPGGTYRIYPDSVTISSGTATIRIPRARLVADHDNNNSGWDWEDVNNFLATVDAVRVYTDDSTNALMKRAPGACLAADTQTAQMHIRDHRLGFVQIVPADYVSNAWVKRTCITRYQYVELNYLAGLTTLPYDYESMIVRLAHTRMAEEPCGCPKVSHLWRDDREVPVVLTAERLNCPFGLSNGAWQAYQFCRQKRILRGGII